MCRIKTQLLIVSIFLPLVQLTGKDTMNPGKRSKLPFNSVSTGGAIGINKRPGGSKPIKIPPVLPDSPIPSDNFGSNPIETPKTDEMDPGTKTNLPSDDSALPRKSEDNEEYLQRIVRGLDTSIAQNQEIINSLGAILDGIKKIAQKGEDEPELPAGANGTMLDTYFKLFHKLFDVGGWKLRSIRPLRRQKPLAIFLTVHLRQLLQVNEAEEYAKVYIWIQMQFFNEFLGWDPSEFDNCHKLQASEYYRMWMPDIHLYNGLDLQSENIGRQTIPEITTKKVNDSGDVFWAGLVDYSYPEITTFTCSFSTFYFPFDYQNCTLVFGSWAYQVDHIVIHPNESRLFDYEANDEWEITSLSHYNSTRKFANSKEYSQSHLEIIMKRKPLFYVVNLIIPSVIITQVSFFGMFTPSSSEGDRTEKVSLGMGTLLAMSVLLLIVSGMIPVSSSYIPLIGLFFLFIMCIISLAVMSTTFIMMIHQRGKRRKRVPKWAQNLFFFRIAPKIGFKIPSVIRREAKHSAQNGIKREMTDLDVSLSENHMSNGVEIPLLDQLPQIKQLSEQIDIVLKGRRRELSEVEYIFLAKILDALMLFLFSILLGIFTLAVFIGGVTQEAPEPTHASTESIDIYSQVLESGYDLTTAAKQTVLSNAIDDSGSKTVN